MSLPDDLTLERFRSFAGKATLPLRPITLVYGPNNSGKSALLRALAMVGASLEAGGSGALRLPERAFPDVRFQDLAWQGEVGSYRWKVGVRWSSGSVREVNWRLNGGSDIEPYISRVEVLRQGQERPWQARENEDRMLVDPDDGQVSPFEGLIPAARSGGPLDDVRACLMAMRGKVRWLAGVRAGVPRIFSAESPDHGSRMGDGNGSAASLVRDADLRADVARFYGALDLPRSLELHEAPSVGHYLSLNPRAQPTWRVHINDTGEGMAQVLPVLVHAALAAREGGIFAVEEPESHLHPNAQRVLARYLCDLAARPTSPRFILETHSRVFLLAVQIAVASGFPADKVAVVWVDQSESGRSTTTVIPVRPGGRLGDGWPLSALGEDLQLARELTRMGRASQEAE